MWTRLGKRLLQFPLVVFIVYTATFALLAAAPGDPLLGESSKVPPQVRQQQRKYYNIDGPWYQQYWDYARTTVVSLGRGQVNLGHSIFYGGRPVAEVMGLTRETWSTGAMKTSLTLGLLALAIAVLVGMHLGIRSAVRQNRLADHLTSAVSVAGVSLPPFVVGSMLIWLLAIELQKLLFRLGVQVVIFPVGGWGQINQLILPAVTLSLPFIAYVARLMRAGMLDVLHSDYIRTARAKGLPEKTVIRKHAFKLAFLPVLSFLGPAAASALTGSFVVEKLFAIPGLGTHFVQSVLNRDQPLILGTVLAYSVLLVGFNVLVDVAYLFVDPRMGREGAL